MDCTRRRCLCSLGAGFNQQPALNRVPTEYEVKAAYLLNFAKFVTWPHRTRFHRIRFHICVLGDDPFGAVLSPMVTGERVNGRTSTIQRGSR